MSASLDASAARSDDRDAPPGATVAARAPCAPEDVERPAPTRPPEEVAQPTREHRRRRPRRDGLEPRPQPRQPRGQHRRGLQPQPEKTDTRRRAPRGRFVRRVSYEEFAASLAEAPHRDHHGQGRRATDAVIDALVEVFEPGDIIVDGGNALFTDTIRREKAVRETGINFVGAGISGGEEGALNGPSIMPGGRTSRG